MNFSKGFIFFLCLPFISFPSLRAELTPETMAAFKKYVAAQEQRIKSQSRSQKDFLWIDRDSQRRNQIRQGETPVEQIHAPQIPGGMIQHWIGGAFIPNATIEMVKRVDQDYSRHKDIYGPDIIDSKVLAREGNHFEIFYRFRKKKILTVVLDTVHQIDFVTPAPHRLYVESRCDKVQEVKHPGRRDEKLLPPGEDNGFLWAMNSYWRMEERDGGVYMECEAITLARDVPLGLGSLVASAVNSLAAESLATTVAAKKRAVAALK